MATNRISYRVEGEKIIVTSNDSNIKQVFFGFGSWGTGMKIKEHPEFYGRSIETDKNVRADDEMWQWDLTMESVKDLYKLISDDLNCQMKSAHDDDDWAPPKADDDVLKTMGNIIAGVVPETLDAFTEAYITAALWSTIDYSAEENGRDGEHLDDNFGIADFSPECMQQIKEDCARFQQENKALLDEAPYSTKSGYSKEALAGHDFWLTREGHGTGFWDRNLGEVGKALTKSAKAFGEFHLYVNNEGQLISD